MKIQKILAPSLSEPKGQGTHDALNFLIFITCE